MAQGRTVERRGLQQQHAVERTSPRTMYLLRAAHYAFSWRCMDTETEELQNMAEWLSLTKKVEYAWHSMLSLKCTPDSAREADTLANRAKRQRDGSNPWNVSWPSDSHRRLEILGDSEVVIHWMNGIGRSRVTSILRTCLTWLINLRDGI